MVASCLNFIALGMMTAALGPALPDLAANAGSSLAAVGAVITALFAGSLIALLIAGPLNDRIGQRPVLLAGVALLALGTFGIAFSGWLPLTLLCAVVAGLGHGAIDISTNVLVAEVFTTRSAAALNLLNVFFGLGAVAGPALASLALWAWGSALPALWVSAGLLLLLAPLIPLLADVPRAALHPAPVMLRARQASPLRSPLLWAIGVLVLIYVGVENGVSGWTTVDLTRTTPLDQATAALITSGFWLALTGGRLAGAIIGARIAPNALLLLMLSGALAGGALLAASTGSASLTIAGVLLLGFCLGPVFPTALAITTASFRQVPATAASIVIALGSLGGTMLPWLQGVLLEQASPAASVLLVAVCTLAMLGLQVGRGMAGRRETAPREDLGREAEARG
jgi:fucose permease